MNKQFLELHPTQKEACDGVLESFMKDGVNCVSLVGAGGTGKSECIRYLAESAPLVLAASTKKAVTVITDRFPRLEVKTFHSRVYRPVFSELYYDMSYACEVFHQDEQAALDIDDGFFNSDQSKHDFTNAAKATGDISKSLSAAKINVFEEKELFLYWAPKDHVGGNLAVDEASMLSEKQINDSLKVFDNVVMVGDNMQLPPIMKRGERDGWTVVQEEFQLTHQFRSIGDVLKYAEHIRFGNDPFEFNWSESVLKAGLNTAINNADEATPIVTYTNAECAKIQKGRKTPYYLICSGTYKGITGKLNEGSGEIEFERNGNTISRPFYSDSRYPVKRADFALPTSALTCHRAQGSQFEHVIVNMNGYKIAKKYNGEEGARKWLYTAVSRAKKSVTLVNFTSY